MILNRKNHWQESLELENQSHTLLSSQACTLSLVSLSTTQPPTHNPPPTSFIHCSVALSFTHYLSEIKSNRRNREGRQSRFIFSFTYYFFLQFIPHWSLSPSVLSGTSCKTSHFCYWLCLEQCFWWSGLWCFFFNHLNFKVFWGFFLVCLFSLASFPLPFFLGLLFFSFCACWWNCEEKWDQVDPFRVWVGIWVFCFFGVHACADFLGLFDSLGLGHLYYSLIWYYNWCFRSWTTLSSGFDALLKVVSFHYSVFISQLCGGLDMMEFLH